MSEEKIMRKQPKQERGQRRVDLLLDAASQVFAEVGHEAATTNAIAARAGVSIGSLYQFFPNKEAIIEALVESYAEALREKFVFDAALSASEMVAELVERVVAFQRSHAGFGPIFMIPDKATAMHAEIVGHVERTLTGYFSTLPTESRHTTAVVLVAMFKAMMPLVSPPDNLPLHTVKSEIKTALLAYLRAVLLREDHPLPPDLV